MAKFSDLKEYKKGELGEFLVQHYLTKKGYTVYKTASTGSHPIDNIAIHKTNLNVFIYDVKTKAKRTHYNDTGLDANDFQKYKKIIEKNNVQLIIFFVDENLKLIYTLNMNTISEKIKNYKTYPKIIKDPKGQDVIYFPLKIMKKQIKFSQKFADKLKACNNRNYNY